MTARAGVNVMAVRAEAVRGDVEASHLGKVAVDAHRVLLSQNVPQQD